MSKMLETKKKILNLLKKKEMTISGLSQELGLSTATISQHLDELQSMGAIEKIDNEHFKKLKYYRARTEAMPVMVKYFIGAIVVLVLASVIFLYHGALPGSPGAAVYTTTPAVIYPTSSHNYTANNSTSAASSNGTLPMGPGGGMMACPLTYYHVNGTITNYSGFTVSYLNYSAGTIADYVIANGMSGNLMATEQIGGVLKEPSNATFTSRQHYYAITQEGTKSSNNTAPGLNLSISPENFTVIDNETIGLTVAVSANATAQQNTYLIRIDGPCDGGLTPFLITVGSAPYSGNVTYSVLPYA